MLPFLTGIGSKSAGKYVCGSLRREWGCFLPQTPRQPDQDVYTHERLVGTALKSAYALRTVPSGTILSCINTSIVTIKRELTTEMTEASLLYRLKLSIISYCLSSARRLPQRLPP